MKKVNLITASLIMCIASMIFIGCTSQSKSELYKVTDSFVESLETTYESYGIFGGSKHSVTTEDGLYTIMPVGRLINVKIDKSVHDKEYQDLMNDLEGHYKNNSHVKSVYICQAGTIMIDCRN